MVLLSNLVRINRPICKKSSSPGVMWKQGTTLCGVSALTIPGLVKSFPYNQPHPSHSPAVCRAASQNRSSKKVLYYLAWFG